MLRQFVKLGVSNILGRQSPLLLTSARSAHFSINDDMFGLTSEQKALREVIGSLNISLYYLKNIFALDCLQLLSKGVGPSC